MEPILTNWGPLWNPSLFGHQPICLQHRWPPIRCSRATPSPT